MTALVIIVATVATATAVGRTEEPTNLARSRVVSNAVERHCGRDTRHGKEVAELQWIAAGRACDDPNTAMPSDQLR